MRSRRLRSPVPRDTLHCSRTACWGVLALALCLAAAANLFAFNHRRLEHTELRPSVQPQADVEGGARSGPPLGGTSILGEGDHARPSPSAGREGSNHSSFAGPPASFHAQADTSVRASLADRGPAPAHDAGGPEGKGHLNEASSWLRQPSPRLPIGRQTPVEIRVVAIPGEVRHEDVFTWPSEGDVTSTIRNFPCSLSEADDIFSASAQAPRQKPWSTSGPCIVSCWPQATGDRGRSSGVVRGDPASCPRAMRACELYQECTHVLLVSAGTENTAARDEGGVSFAALMHAASPEDSLSGVRAAAAADGAAATAGWAGAVGSFELVPRPRTYYVVSFGGSGSKMLGGWLSERGRGMVKEVFHIHDPKPASKLYAKQARRGVSAGRAGRGKDFRGYDFPEGDFPNSGNEVQDVDSYRVILIFKDPAEALVSRYFYNHCRNLRGADCGATEQEFPGLESYAEESGDRLHMEAFYDNYCSPTIVAEHEPRNYPVVCINYHKIWDNAEAVVTALGLPLSQASKLPTRTETVRNDHTSAARGEPFTLEVRERLRQKHVLLTQKIFTAPAVSVV